MKRYRIRKVLKLYLKETSYKENRNIFFRFKFMLNLSNFF